jgi:hypothetical protein
MTAPKNALAAQTELSSMIAYRGLTALANGICSGGCVVYDCVGDDPFRGQLM